MTYSHDSVVTTLEHHVFAELEQYRKELEGILSRFTHDAMGLHIKQDDATRFREIALELNDFFGDTFIDGERYQEQLARFVNEAFSTPLGIPSYHGIEEVKGLVGAALRRSRRNSSILKSQLPSMEHEENARSAVLVSIAERLHSVVRQMKDRRENRPTLEITDEYDLQDLFRALVKLFFEDLRPEEWTPSYAGGSSRMDFFLPEIDTVVELKMMRPTLSDKRLGEELIVDKDRYKKHPGCKTLFCIVYDPQHQLSNPRGIEADLTETAAEMTTRVFVVPR
jgi:hypothetical protein